MRSLHGLESCGDDQSRPALGHQVSESSSRYKNLECCLDSGRSSSQVSGENPSKDGGSGYLHQEPGGSHSEKKVNGASLHCKEAHGSPATTDPGKPNLRKELKDYPREYRTRGLHKPPGQSDFRAGIERAGTRGGTGSASCRGQRREHSDTSTDPGPKEIRGPGRGNSILSKAVRGRVWESQSVPGGCCGLRSEDKRRGSKIQRNRDHVDQYPRYQQTAPQHPRLQPPENLQFLYYQSLHYEWLRSSFANPLACEPRYPSFKNYACQYYDLVQQFGFQHYGFWPNLNHPSQVPPPSPSYDDEALHYYQESLPNRSDNLSEQLSPASYSPNPAFQYLTPQQSSPDPACLDDQFPQRSTPHENFQYQASPPSRSNQSTTPYHNEETLLENSKDAISGCSEHHQLTTGNECTNKSGWIQSRNVARQTWNDKTEKEITLILNRAPRPNPEPALFPPGRGIHARKREADEYVFQLPAQTDASYSDQLRRNLVSLPTFSLETPPHQ